MTSWIVMGMGWAMHVIAVLTSQIQIRYTIARQLYIPQMLYLCTIINICIHSSSSQSDIDNDLVGDSCDTNQDRYEMVHHLRYSFLVSFVLHQMMNYQTILYKLC